MADLTITASQVVLSGKPKMEAGTVDAAFTEGMVLYRKTLNGSTWGLAVADGTPIQAGSYGLGIPLTDGSTNDWAVIVTQGDVNLGVGATLRVGRAYAVSETAGKIAEADSDVAGYASGSYISTLGYCFETNVLKFAPNPVQGMLP